MAGIRVESVSKRFRLYAKDRPYTLQETLVRGFRKLKVQEEFWALQDVSLEVAAGEMVGVIGRNGCGQIFAAAARGWDWPARPWAD